MAAHHSDGTITGQAIAGPEFFHRPVGIHLVINGACASASTFNLTYLTPRKTQILVRSWQGPVN